MAWSISIRNWRIFFQNILIPHLLLDFMLIDFLFVCILKYELLSVSYWMYTL